MTTLDKILKNRLGFSLAEMIISTFIGVLILIVIATTFSLNEKTLRKANLTAELTQNARVALDLMSREIRQAKNIVTTLPVDNSNPATVAHELLFEDGHITSQIQYIRYYSSGTELWRQVIVYYFDVDPAIYVHFDDQNAFGGPTATTTDDKIIGEDITQMDFYGPNIINVDLILQKQGEQEQIKSIINPRNI
jgi:type II secretory pathway pseudopilin PulG